MAVNMHRHSYCFLGKVHCGTIVSLMWQFIVCRGKHIMFPSAYCAKTVCIGILCKDNMHWFSATYCAKITCIGSPLHIVQRQHALVLCRILCKDNIVFPPHIVQRQHALVLCRITCTGSLPHNMHRRSTLFLLCIYKHKVLM